jgi:hypothetical protein
MSALLNEVDAALKQDASPNVAFPVVASTDHDGKDKYNVDDVLDQNDGGTRDDQAMGNEVPRAEVEEPEDDTGVTKEVEVDTSSIAIGVPQTAVIVESLCTGVTVVGRHLLIALRYLPRCLTG